MNIRLFSRETKSLSLVLKIILLAEITTLALVIIRQNPWIQSLGWKEQLIKSHQIAVRYPANTFKDIYVRNNKIMLRSYDKYYLDGVLTGTSINLYFSKERECDTTKYYREIIIYRPKYKTYNKIYSSCIKHGNVFIDATMTIGTDHVNTPEEKTYKHIFDIMLWTTQDSN